MWLRLIAGIILGLVLYIGSALMFNNLITGTSQIAAIGRQAIPISIAVIVVGITAMGIFHHS